MGVSHWSPQVECHRQVDVSVVLGTEVWAGESHGRGRLIDGESNQGHG